MKPTLLATIINLTALALLLVLTPPDILYPFKILLINIQFFISGYEVSHIRMRILDDRRKGKAMGKNSTVMQKMPPMQPNQQKDNPFFLYPTTYHKN